jgi:hypothetical protein
MTVCVYNPSSCWARHASFDTRMLTPRIALQRFSTYQSYLPPHSVGRVVSAGHDRLGGGVSMAMLKSPLGPGKLIPFGLRRQASMQSNSCDFPFGVCGSNRLSPRRIE